VSLVSSPAPRVTIALLIGLLAVASSAVAQVPRLLHYQATLVEGNFPVEGPVDLEVAFFADETGGEPLAGWTETRTDVSVTAGRIHLLLGSQTPLPDALLDASSLHLQLTVNGEALPRMPVASTAYALRAGQAEGVAAGGITPAALHDGAVTAPALADDAVTTDALAPGSVTTPILADDAVTTVKLAPSAVSTATLADGAVTSAKLGPSAVVGDVLADGSVTSAKLANGSVTAAKITTGAVVSTLNGLTDDIRLIGGDDITVTPNDDAGTITISTEDNGSPSSRRWKTNVEPLDGLALVRQLRGVRYEWIESGRPDIGLIAEEVGAVVPEVVTYADNGVDAESVHYAKLVALLIEAVKQQQTQIEADRTRLQALQARVEALERAFADTTTRTLSAP
jgi:hypothetical protein